MANWYSGVLNTGKRRYGHPALNGVLPVPWLPLKKGQTLVNNDHHDRGGRPATTNGVGKKNQAVVLTLRKPSSVRRSRVLSTPALPVGISIDPSSSTAAPLEAATRNPWEDTPHRLQTTPAIVNHRLSFDHASGVIMLPEDESWLGDDLDSDEEDYGAEDSHSLHRSQTEPILAGGSGLSASPTRLSRYGTYFHHPERRRQPIPGAFPR